MKLTDITTNSIKNISNKELLSLHVRIHQLYALAIRREEKKKILIDFLIKVHETLVNEMNKRKIKHVSPLTLSISLKFLRKIRGNND